MEETKDSADVQQQQPEPTLSISEESVEDYTHESRDDSIMAAGSSSSVTAVPSGVEQGLASTRKAQEIHIMQQLPKSFICSVCHRTLTGGQANVLRHFRRKHQQMLSERCKFCGLGFIECSQRLAHEYTCRDGNPESDGNEADRDDDDSDPDDFIDNSQQQYTYVPPKPIKMSKELKRLVLRETEVVSPGEESDRSTAREAVRRKKKSQRRRHHHEKKGGRRRRNTSSSSSSSTSSDDEEESLIPSPARKKRDQRPTPIKVVHQHVSPSRNLPTLKQQLAVRRTLEMTGPDVNDLGIENPMARWSSQPDISAVGGHDDQSVVEPVAVDSDDGSQDLITPEQERQMSNTSEDPLVSDEGKNDSTTSDSSQGKEEPEVVTDYGKKLVAKEKFINGDMSPVESFFTSLTVYIKARATGQSYSRASERVKRDSKNLLSQTAAALNVNSFMFADGRFKLSLLPELRESLHLDIDIWDPVSRQRISNVGDCESENPKVDLALFKNDRFCLIADFQAFKDAYCCKYCRRDFSRPNNLKKHERDSCPFLRWRETNPDLSDKEFFLNIEKQQCELVFVSGRYKGRELLEQKLDRVGIQLPPNCGPFNRSIMCVDIESLLIEAMGVKPTDTDKLRYTNRHVPVVISVATDLKGYTRSKYFLASAPYSNFMRAACEYMNEISDVNFKKERKRWRLQLAQLKSLIKIAFKKKRYKFAAEVQNVLEEFLQVLRRMPVYTFAGGQYDLPICSRQGGLVSHFHKLDGVMPTVSVKDKNHWLSFTTAKTKFLDVILMLGRTGNLRSFLHSTGVPSLSSKIWFPFSMLTSFERMSEPMSVFPPIDQFYSDLTQSNPLKEEYQKYEGMVAKCHGDSGKALEKLGIDKIPETAEEKHGRLQALCVEKGFKTLGDYLAYYCCLDTVPTVYATQKLRTEFWEVTEGLDMCHFSTVSSFSFQFFCNQLAVQAASDRNYLCLLDKEAHGLIKEALVGGLSHSVESIAVVGHTPIRPHSYKDCEIVQQISMYDIRSMYSSTMKGLLCSTLGFYTIRVKEKGFEAEMMLERSLVAQTFLQFLAKVERQVFIRTQTAQYGEKSFICGAVKYKVDGAYKVPQPGDKPPKWGIIEVNGCAVHGHLSEGGCCDPDGISPVSGRPYKELYAETMERAEKLKQLRQVASLETFWTCQIQKKYKTDPIYRNFAKNYVVRARPDPVIKRTDDWRDIYDLVIADKLHGYVKCDLKVPEHLYEMFEATLPPFFRKVEIGRKNLDERQRKIAEETGYLQKPTGMLISTYDGKALVLTTTLFKYYVTELGLECTDISLLLQFKNQEGVFAHWFDNTQTKRLHAKKHGLKSLDLACKAILNHSWGFSLTKVEDRKSLSFIKGDKLLEYYKRDGFQGYTPVGDDDNKYKLHEVCLAKTRAVQNLPKQVGTEIALNSKIYFSRFIHLLLGKFCDPRKYSIVCLDTDSCALAMSCTEFIDLAKNEECRGEISARLNDFFVPQNEPDKTDLALAPGLWDLESKADIAISLAPKCYMLLSMKDLVAKFASKGVKKNAENAHVLNFGAFFATLFRLNKDQYMAMIRGLRPGLDSWHYTYEQSKKALTAVNPKWSYCSHGVHHFSHEVYNNEERFSQLYPIRDCNTDYKSIWLHVMGMVKANLGAKKLVLGPEEKIPQELAELGGIPSGSENESDSGNEALDELLTLLMENI